MQAAQEIPFAPVRAALLIFTLLAPLACDLDGRSADPDDEYWLTRLRRAEEDLRREDLTSEERGLAMVRMARAQSGLGRQSKAVAIWEGLRTDPDADLVARTRATYRLAHWHEDQKRWNEAIVHYREFASLYNDLSRERTSSFDRNKENPASLLFHVGEIQEYGLQSFDEAEGSYLDAIAYAEGMDSSLHRDHLKNLYGDFLLRRGQIEDALVQYEPVATVEPSEDWPPSTVSTIARVRMVKCLCLLGRCAEARRALQPMAERWAGTEYELYTGYVKQGQELLDQHCSE